MDIMLKISRFFSSRSSASFECLRDVHAHILPGIDDGVSTVEESLQALLALSNLGYKKVVATPHIMSERYPNSSALILEKVREINEALSQSGIDLLVEPAAEYYLDDGFSALLGKRDILAIEGKYVLFETSHGQRPFNLEHIIFDISSQGYIPLMAHPERHHYLTSDLELFRDLKNRGVLFQANIGSFGGVYGKNVEDAAFLLAKQGMIDFIGTDIHSPDQIEKISKILKDKKFIKAISKNRLLN